MTSPQKVGFVASDPTRDIYTYTYTCGHELSVPGVAMGRGGQVVPPICPSCHDKSEIDKLEWENWSRDPNWNGYLSLGSGNSSPASRQIQPPGFITWLDLSINAVRARAW